MENFKINVKGITLIALVITITGAMNTNEL